MAKTSRDAYRHMRALGNFFSDFNRASDAAVEEFIKRSRQRKYLRQSLKRLEARGFVARRAGGLAVTRMGKRFFKKLLLREEIKAAQGRWDGKWRLIAFDVPVSENAARYRLYALLAAFGFVALQRSVWISPNPLGEVFWKMVVMEDLDRFCKAMVVEHIEGDEKLRARFKFS
ncbi:MAG: hypothetical protein Q8P88_02035 [Candidatus Jorgensenbacteria bacterium]|nr:hypothetical protein [Candidatus Jorgensenbacteria bacterium]